MRATTHTSAATTRSSAGSARTRSAPTRTGSATPRTTGTIGALPLVLGASPLRAPLLALPPLRLVLLPVLAVLEPPLLAVGVRLVVLLRGHHTHYRRHYSYCFAVQGPLRLVLGALLLVPLVLEAIFWHRYTTHTTIAILAILRRY